MAVLRLVPPSGAPIEVSKDKALVGREPSCDVVLNDGSVSRKHARLEKRGAAWFVVDQGSANGTFLDSQRVGETVLLAGQDLRFGALPFRVELEPEPPDLAETMPGADEHAATVVQLTPMTPPPPPPRPPAAPLSSGPPPLPLPPKPPAPPAPPTVDATPPLPVRPAGPPPTPAASVMHVPPPPPRPPAAAGPRPPAIRSASPVPPMPPPRPGGGAPPKTGKGPLFWIAGGCCGCLALVLLFAAVLGGGLYYFTGDAVKAARDQIQDIKSGDMRAAYGRLSSSYQASSSQEEFEAFVARHPGLRDNADSTFPSRSITNGTAKISGVLTPRTGVPEPVVYRMVKEGGAWKIAAIEFAGESSSNGGGRAETADAGEVAGRTAGSGGSLELEPTGVQKEPSEGGTKVTIGLRATGVGVQRAGDAYMVHLAEDLETVGPDGARINSLSKDNVQVLNDRSETEDAGSRDFQTEITLLDAPPGAYKARLTIHDKVSGQTRTADVPFTLP